jgi:hypothetical protein
MRGIDPKSPRLSVGGLVEWPLHLTMADLQKMEKIEVPAVAFAKVSHPAGTQWKYGGVGNARWAACASPIV